MIQYCVMTWDGVLCKSPVDMSFVEVPWASLTDKTQIALFQNPVVAGRAYRAVGISDFQVVPWFMQAQIVRPH